MNEHVNYGNDDNKYNLMTNFMKKLVGKIYPQTFDSLNLILLIS